MYNVSLCRVDDWKLVFIYKLELKYRIYEKIACRKVY